MIEFLVVIGGTMVLSMITLTDDALSAKKQKQFLRLFKEQAPYRTLIGFFVSLLSTKPKDWVFDNGLTLKKPFHPELAVYYQEGIEKKEERLLRLSFKERKIIEYRWLSNEPRITVRTVYQKIPPLNTQDHVKMERVLAHLHTLHAEFLDRKNEKELREKETEEERINRHNARFKQEVLTFLEAEPSWNEPSHALSWGREVDPLSITFTLYFANTEQYVCFYDKANKQIQSNVMIAENETVFTHLQATLDAWCLEKIQK